MNKLLIRKVLLDLLITRNIFKPCAEAMQTVFHQNSSSLCCGVLLTKVLSKFVAIDDRPALVLFDSSAVHLTNSVLCTSWVFMPQGFEVLHSAQSIKNVFFR